MPGDCILWGSAGHARVVSEVLVTQGYRIVALIDRAHDAVPAVPGAALFVGETGFEDFLSYWDGGDLSGFVCVGGARGRDRLECLERFQKQGILCPAIVSERASVSQSAKISDGCQVLAGAVVAADVTLGAGCIINHGAVVDHECKLGKGVHIAPGATVTGCVTIEDRVFVGAGATVIPRLTIGHDAFIAAGATVVRTVPAGKTVAGTPARPVRRKDAE